jgi:hypothetical protein
MEGYIHDLLTKKDVLAVFVNIVTFEIKTDRNIYHSLMS